MKEKSGFTEADGFGEGEKSGKSYVSQAVIKRLPRYFRYLRELMSEGVMRISSGELSARMNVTASQIRQDLNCFGGFGQQGYGYNVNYLYAKICEILGVGAGFKAVILGAGNLGRALAHHTMFEKRGVDVVAIFDVAPEVIGKNVGGLTVLPMDGLEAYLRENPVDIAVFTMPKNCAVEVAERLRGSGVSGIWNFTGKELDMRESGIVVESVHMGDSLMTLCYEMCHRQEGMPETDGTPGESVR